MRDVAVILTCYNRPKLVADSIASVLQQDCDRWRLYLMDDGSNEETRTSIQEALKGAGDVGVWWKGPDRSKEDRKATISYSRNINIALNECLQDEKYVTYLCDDDILYPESVRVRAEFLDKTTEADVVYGRLRAVQFSPKGFNTWDGAISPTAGMHFPRPTGRREFHNEGQSAKTYFADWTKDEETGLPYVEEAMWKAGPMRYGEFREFIECHGTIDPQYNCGEGMVDHNQVMHRRLCLAGQWPDHPDGGKEWWGESKSWPVGDYAFFMRLSERGNLFYGVEEWVASKKYHAQSDGIVDGEVRE